MAACLPPTLPGLLARRVRERPEDSAFVVKDRDGWRHVSFGEFAGRARAIAGGLRRRGIARGQRVAILAPNRLEWELVHHGALAAGTAVVGLDPLDAPDRLRRILREVSPSALVVRDLALLESLGADAIAAVRLIVTLEEGAKEGFPLRQIEREGLGLNDLPEISPGEDATVIYTSGTTGLPKGIVYSHRQVAAACQSILEALRPFQPGARLVCWLPLSNLFQRIVNFCGIAAGSMSWIVERPSDVMDAVAAAEPDLFIGVPRFFEKLWTELDAEHARRPFSVRVIETAARRVGAWHSTRVRAGRHVSAPLRVLYRIADRGVLARLRRPMGPRLKCLLSGSAPMPPWLLESFHSIGWLVLEAYGVSEDVIPVAANRLDVYRFGSVGKPLRGNDVRIEPDGALAVKGPGVFSGYLEDSEPPALTPDGWLRTGDVGFFDADGFLHLTGRAGEMIKTSGGRSIAPAAVEAVFRRVPSVSQAMVIGRGRKCLTALLTLEGGVGSPDFHREVHEAFSALAPWQRPAALLVLPRPFSPETGELTANLKLRRSAIEKKYAPLFDAMYEALDGSDVSFPMLFFVSDKDLRMAEAKEFRTRIELAAPRFQHEPAREIRVTAAG